MSLASEVTIPEALAGLDAYGLVRIDVVWLWNHGQRVIYDPEWGRGHIAVYGFTKKDEQGRRDAAFASTVLIEPTIRPKSTA